MRVAALADVHGNAPALAAVLEEVERERPDLVVFCGDLTWGSLPQETLALVRALEIPARFVRGNADRSRRSRDREPEAVDDSHAHAGGPARSSRIRADGARRRRRARPQRASVTARRAPTRSASPSGRRRSGFASSWPASMRASSSLAHVHRELRPRRRLESGRSGPGSVGFRTRPAPGARWALLGPEVELRRTDYDVEAAIAHMRATDDPRVERSSSSC